MWTRINRQLHAPMLERLTDDGRGGLPTRAEAGGATCIPLEAAVSSRTNQAADDCPSLSEQLTGGAAGRTNGLSMTSPTSVGIQC